MHNNTLCDCLFYSLLFTFAQARSTLLIQISSAVRQYRFVSFRYDHYLAVVSVCVCVAVRAVRFCWSHKTDWNLSAASRWNRRLVPQQSSLTFSIFLYFLPSPLSFLLFLEVGAARGLLQDSHTTKVVTAEIANKSHSCRSFIQWALSSWPCLVWVCCLQQLWVVSMLEKFYRTSLLVYFIIAFGLKGLSHLKGKVKSVKFEF